MRAFFVLEIEVKRKNGKYDGSWHCTLTKQIPEGYPPEGFKFKLLKVASYETFVSDQIILEEDEDGQYLWIGLEWEQFDDVATAEKFINDLKEYGWDCSQSKQS